MLKLPINDIISLNMKATSVEGLAHKFSTDLEAKLSMNVRKN